MSSEYHCCSKCGKECKDKKGLSKHEKVCIGLEQHICPECNLVLKNRSNLKVHISHCPVIKEREKNQEEEKRKQELLTDSQLQLNNLKETYESKIRSLERQNEVNVKQYQDETKEARSLVKELQSKLDQLTKEKNDISNERTLILTKHLSLMDDYRLLNTQNTSAYDPIVVQANVGRISNGFILNIFTKEHINNLINIPHQLILSVSGLNARLFNLGMGNFIRLSDTARKVLIWNKPDHGEIRDLKGSSFVEYLLDLITPMIESQFEFLFQEIEKVTVIDKESSYLDLCKKRLQFTKYLQSKGDNIKQDLQRMITDRARHISDNKLDSVVTSSFSTIELILSEKLFPSIEQWIALDYMEMGVYIGKHIKNSYWIEGASTGDLPYIILQDDYEQNHMIYSNHLGSILKDVIYHRIQSKLYYPVIHHLLKQYFKNTNKIDNKIAMGRLESFVKVLEKPLNIEAREPMNQILAGMIKVHRIKC
jgi:hypothetical protein